VLKRIVSWLGEKTGVGEKPQPAGAPSFEPLEPRVLLSADPLGTQPSVLLPSQLDEPAVVTDFNRQRDESMLEMQAPIISVDVVDSQTTAGGTGKADAPEVGRLLGYSYSASGGEPQPSLLQAVAVENVAGSPEPGGTIRWRTDIGALSDTRISPLYIEGGASLLTGSNEVNLGGQAGRTEIVVQTVGQGSSCPQVQLQVHVGSPVYTTDEDAGYLLVEGGRLSDIPNTPMVPYIPVEVLLPPGTTVAAVTTCAGGVQALDRTYDLALAPEPVPAFPEDLPPGVQATQPANVSPPTNPATAGQVVQLVSVQHVRGYALAVLNLYPIQVGADGQVFCSKIDVVLDAQEEPAGTWIAPVRNSAADVALVADMVANPQDLSAYEGLAQPVLQSSTLPAGSYDYVIITGAALAPGFLPLVQEKQARGVDTIIYTVEDIYANYTGVDPAAQVRNFIRDAYATWGLEYVLLGGDTDVVPHRGAYMTADIIVLYDMPADLYFACLDGSWNSDGDSAWGEPTDGEAGGDVDLLADIYVGRAPVANLVELRNFVCKTVQYETITPPNLTHGLWLGGRTTVTGASSDGSGCLELISNELMPQEYTYTKLYKKAGTYTQANIIDALNASPHIVAHVGHAYVTQLMELYGIDADALTNDFPFFVAADFGCLAGAFDLPIGDDCIAEHLVLAEHGAFAVVANSREGWLDPDASRWFIYMFFEAAFGPPAGHDPAPAHFNNHLGATNQLSRELNISGVQPTGAFRWCYFTTNLLGDPETPLRQPEFHATSSLPARSQILAAPPVDFAVNLSQAYRPASVDAADLKVNGVGATSVTFTDADTITFDFASSPVVEQGPQAMEIAAGSILRDGDGSANAPWRWTFYYDTLPTMVTATTPAEGSLLDTTPAEIILEFNEPMDPATVDVTNLVLSHGRVSAATAVNGYTVHYSITGLSTYGDMTYALKAGAITDNHGTPVGCYEGHFGLTDPLLMRWDSTDVPKTMPQDVGVFQSTLTIQDAVTIADLDVMLDFDLWWAYTPSFCMIAPDGTRIEFLRGMLTFPQPAMWHPFVGTILDDEAAQPVTYVPNPQNGHYRPARPLSVFDGLDTQGTWTLELTCIDEYAFYPDGILNAWSLLVHPADAGASPEITVLGNGVSIADGDTTPATADHTDFGSVSEGWPGISRTFTVRNDGTGTLTLGTVGVPTGFTLTEALSPTLAPGASDTLTVRLDTTTPGTKSGEISFTNNDSDENPFNFQITGTVVGPTTNLAVGRPAVASTSYTGLPAANAIDGNATSRWSSQFSNNEWIYVDLGLAYTVNRVVLRWETAYGRGYKLQVSNNASTWSEVYGTTTGDGSVDDITLTSPGSGRYVRMLGTQRGTTFGYSLYEFEVYGGPPVNHAPVVSSFSKSTTQNTPLPFAAGDFAGAFTDPDAGDSLQKVKITSLPGHGTLTLNSTPVTVNQEVPVAQIGTLVYTPTSGYTGSDSFQWNGSDGGLYAASAATVNLTINAAAANLALGKTAVASTSYTGFPASNVTDGNTSSRWSSQFSNSQWIYVDLGSVYTINRVVLRWETAYGRGYKLQVSTDASTWSDVYSTTTGDGGVDDITLSTPGTGRYLRMLGTQRATTFGYSLYELEVYGAPVTNLALTKPAVASTSYTGFPASNVTDGNPSSRWSSQYSDSQWLYVDLGSVYTIKQVVLRWEAAYGRGYKLQVSNDASTWSDVYSTTTGDGGVDDLTLTSPVSGRYVRMLGTQRATTFGYSLYELEVYGAPVTNLALTKPAVASTSYTGFPASNVTDGNTSSRWSSQYSDSQWLYVDLGSVYAIKQVVLRWEAAYGRGYQLQVSNDASTWSDVYSTATGDGGVDDITLSSPASGRYVRLLGTRRATTFGYSLWEFEVYG